jgi:hypothetical protein
MLLQQCNRCKRLVIELALLLAAAAVAGAVTAAETACASPPYRVFDFWLGEWDVTAGDGRVGGRNHITSEQQGCVLVERWQGAQGDTGLSMNFYDPAQGRWRQVWVSPGAEIDIAGGMEEGSMVLEGTITYLRDVRSRPFRGTWTPLDDGRVRQFFEEANDDGDWTPWFEGFYRKVDQPR